MIEIGYVGKKNKTNSIIFSVLKDNYDCKIHNFGYKPLKEKLSELVPESLDLSIIDLHTTTGSALSTINTASTLLTGVPILALHIYEELKLVKPLIEAGAQGYLTTPTSEHELTSAVDALLSGESFISKNVRNGKV